MLSYEEQQTIRETSRGLAQMYPTEANYSSKSSLWACGLKDGLITRAEYDDACKFYGRLWNYVGD